MHRDGDLEVTSPRWAAAARGRLPARLGKLSVAARAIRTCLYLVVLLYVPCILAVVTVLLAVAASLTFTVLSELAEPRGFPLFPLFAMGIVVGIDIAIALLVILLLRGLVPLLFRGPTEEAPGFELTRGEHPRLLRLIANISAQLKVPPPDECYLSIYDAAFISDRRIITAAGRTRRVRTLVIGAGHVVHLKVHELAAILCHEMAHAATGDTRWSRRADRFNRSLLYAIRLNDNPHSGGVANAVTLLALRAYYWVFSRLYMADARRREFRADRLAAGICGPRTVREVLVKSLLVSRLPRLSIQSLLEEYTRYDDAERVENLYEEHRRRWKELPRDLRKRAEREMFLEETSSRAAHPCLRDRLAALARLDAPNWRVPHAATDLFEDWPALERRITEVLLAVVGQARKLRLARLDMELRRTSW